MRPVTDSYATGQSYRLPPLDGACEHRSASATRPASGFLASIDTILSLERQHAGLRSLRRRLYRRRPSIGRTDWR